VPVSIAPPATVAFLTLAALAGAVLLNGGGTPYEPAPAALVSIGMTVLTVVACAGLLIARGRWARVVSAALAAVWVGVVAASPLSPVSITVLVAAAFTVGATAGPWLGRWLRRLPPAQGPPPSVSALLIALLATPAVVGLASPSGLHAVAWGWSASSLLLAPALGRAAPGSLSGARFVHPAVGAAAAVLVGFPGGVAYGALVVASGVLAWRRDVALAVSPISTDRTAPVPFPPELTPPEVLAAAGLDDRGRPLEDDT
jgi:hypothetical protein